MVSNIEKIKQLSDKIVKDEESRENEKKEIISCLEGIKNKIKGVFDKDAICKELSHLIKKISS